MKIYKGNLEIKIGDKTDYSELEEITGNLSIHSNTELPKLTTVGGYLSIHSNTELPKLTTVGGYLSIHSNTELQAPKLTAVGGDLYIYSNIELPKLTAVGGDLSINSNTKLQAPKLTTVGGYLYIYSNTELPKLTTVGGDLYIYSNTELPKLTTVGGNLYIYSNISINMAKNLWKKNKKNLWTVSNLVPDWLIKRVATKKDTVFRINNVELPFEWFEKIRKDKLSAEEVFAIDNIEHRRLAYEFMDKTKMKSLNNYKVLDEQIDDKGNPMKIISFNVQNMKEDLIFYNCFCPSTQREYFIQTKEKTCKKAKSASFGLSDVIWEDEW